MQVASIESQLKSTLAAEEEKLLTCIHCGLCLEACPTYVLTGDENDGPRGRLYLMRAVGEARLENNSKAFERHIDRCLGCRACEQVCPAGVEYGQLLEAARAELYQTNSKRGARYVVLRFLLRSVWLYPKRLRLVFGAARVIRKMRIPRFVRESRLRSLFSKQTSFALALLESSSPKFAPTVQYHPNETRSTNPVSLFKGCVGSGLFSHVNEATERVLAVNGFSTSSPKAQVCCGALHAHAGDLENARRLARQNIAAFETANAQAIVTNAGGCGAMLASYAHLLEDDAEFAARAKSFSARVRDVSQQLTNVKGAATANESQSVTYDASCHLLYGQHAGDAPLRMLNAIGPLDLVPLAGAERCCGGAGIYNLLEPELSGGVLAEKLANIRATGATMVATGNPGCQMQIGAGALLSGLEVNVCHPVELLDQAYAAEGFYDGKG